MATLRTAFVQTYQSSTSCLGFLATLPCLISSLLNCNQHSCSEEKEKMRGKFSKVSCSFQKIEKLLKSDKQKFMWISACYTSSLHEIMDSNSSDFQAEKEQGSFIHALELINEPDLQDDTFDLKTVQSEVISLVGHDPNSTEISLTSDFQNSDLEDL